MVSTLKFYNVWSVLTLLLGIVLFSFLTIFYSVNLLYLVLAAFILSLISRYYLPVELRILLPLGSWLSTVSTLQILVVITSMLYPYTPSFSFKVLSATSKLDLIAIISPAIASIIPQLLSKSKTRIFKLKRLELVKLDYKGVIGVVVGLSVGFIISHVKIASVELTLSYMLGVIVAIAYTFYARDYRVFFYTFLSWITLFTSIVRVESKSFN